MFASLALFGILGLPILTGTMLRALARLTELRPELARPTIFVAVAGSLLVLASAWAWWALNPEVGDAVVGGWTSVSFTGTPLTVGFGAGACSILIALTAARTSQLLNPNSPTRIEVISSHGLLVLGAALAILGGTTPTLLIGLGIMEIAGVWHAARRRNSRVAVRAFGTQLVGLLLASLVLTMHSAGSNDFRLSTSPEPMAELLTTLMSAAIVLHANLLPFSNTQEATSDLQTTAGLLGAMALVMHTGQTAAWVPALAAITCAFWSVRALGTSDASIREARVREASAAFSLAFGIHVPTAATAGWLLGSALLQQPGVARIFGIASLLALPGSAGFIALAATPGVIFKEPLTMAMSVLHTGCHAVLGFALLRHTFDAVNSSAIRTAVRDSLRPGFLPAFALAAAHALMMGTAPQFFGGPSFFDALTNTSVAIWIALGFGTLLGVVLWRIGGNELDESLARADALLMRTDSAFHPLYAALDRLRRSFGAIMSLLDSEGALLLTCLALVLAVLILGQTTP